MIPRILTFLLFVTSCASAQNAEEAYKLLATGRTSTMENEINEMAADGYRFAGTMGGDMRGGEIVTVMARTPLVEGKGRYRYKLLATGVPRPCRKNCRRCLTWAMST